MLSVEPSGVILGATICGLDLSKRLDDGDLGRIFLNLGRYGVLCFPGQSLDPIRQKAFCERLGPLHQNERHRVPGVPEVSILSNIVENGRNIGYVDAGMIWHRDVTNRKIPAFATVLHALKVPRRNGKALGNTQFINTQAAYDDLAEDIKRRLTGRMATHSSEKYNERVRDAGSKRPAFGKLPNRTPPISHPILRAHPLTGRTTLYCDPGSVVRIEGLPEGESDDLIRLLNEHQLQPKYRYDHVWTEGDVLMWDNFSTLHRVSLDYGPDEPRLIQRSQVMAGRVLDPAFVESMLARAGDTR